MKSGFVYNPAGYVKNFNSLRSACFWAGGLGLAQSLIWIVLTLVGILSYSCVIIVEATSNYGNIFQVLFAQLYFGHSYICGNSIPVYLKTVLNSADMLIWISVYLAVAVCWLLASVVIMKYIKQDEPRMVSGVLWTWILVTLCICAMDLALAIIFGIDYGHFNREASINEDPVQLLAGMVVSMSLVIISLKGFVLWIINVGFLIYLAMRAINISRDKNGATNLFMPRKEYDDIVVNRTPINAYQEEEQKPSVISTVFANEGFEPDNNVQERAPDVINRAAIVRAAHLSTNVSLEARRFRNLDNFQQYPPSSRPESIMPEPSQQQQTSPIVVSAFPAPDYTPPMQRATQNPNRNLRFQ